MARNVKLLLTESVDSLGIVGDVVNVRSGYARNFLLPRNLATQPSDEAIQAVAAKRADAERQLADLRQQREAMVQKMQGLEITLIRSCNDQGILYGAVTQQDIATALAGQGHHVKAREVRLAQTIKRIDTYDVHVKLDADLDAQVKLWVVADRKLDLERRDEATAEELSAPIPEPTLVQEPPKTVKGWGKASDAAPEQAAEKGAGKSKKGKGKKADKA